MKIAELIQIEAEQIELLRERSHGGDNEAAQVLLEHLRCTSKEISEWKRQKDAEIARKAPKKRQYTLDPDKKNQP